MDKRPQSRPQGKSCPRCSKSPTKNRPSQQRRPNPAPRKQDFNPLERIGITLGNKFSGSVSPTEKRIPVRDINDLDCGDHICIDRYRPMTYTHHGIYLGFGMVIHYDFKEIKVITLDQFTKGQRLHKMLSPVAYPPEVVMARAVSRLGEHRYNIMINNCEHFVRWARNGQDIPME